MTDKELYLQKTQAQLNEWKADLDKLKAKTSGISADVQLGLKTHIRELESRIADITPRLSELAAAGNDTWKSIKESMEADWDSLRSAFSEAASKFMDKTGGH